MSPRKQTRAKSRLSAGFDSLDRIVDPGKVCERCRDRSHCDSCYFKIRERINGDVPIDPILLARTEAAKGDNHGISMPACHSQALAGREAIMKVNQVSVLVSKKTCPPMPFDWWLFVRPFSIPWQKGMQIAQLAMAGGSGRISVPGVTPLA